MGFSVPDNNDYERAINDAQYVYEEFYHRRSDGTDHMINLSWPSVQGVVGKALILGYWSDKFDHYWREYTHKHLRPYPLIVRELCKEEGDKPVPGNLKRTFSKPYPPVWAFLGYALDLQIEGKEKFFDWKRIFQFDPRKKGNQKLPILGWDENKKVLIIQPQTGEPPILLHSRILKVTSAGIEN